MSNIRKIDKNTQIILDLHAEREGLKTEIAQLGEIMEYKLDSSTPLSYPRGEKSMGRHTDVLSVPANLFKSEKIPDQLIFFIGSENYSEPS